MRGVQALGSLRRSHDGHAPRPGLEDLHPHSRAEVQRHHEHGVRGEGLAAVLERSLEDHAGPVVPASRVAEQVQEGPGQGRANLGPDVA